jgi:hypothetical protein
MRRARESPESWKSRPALRRSRATEAERLKSSCRGIDSGFNGIKGLTFDAWGNLYFGSENNAAYGGLVDGLFMIPNEGTPTNPNLNFADTVRVSPVGTGFPVLIDPRGLLWIPDGGGGSNYAPSGSVAAACTTTSAQTIDATCTASSVLIWQQGALNAGASPVGTPGAPQTLFYSFSKPITGNFTLSQPSASNFTVLTSNPIPYSRSARNRCCLAPPAPRTQPSLLLRAQRRNIAGASTLSRPVRQAWEASAPKCRLTIPPILTALMAAMHTYSELDKVRRHTPSARSQTESVARAARQRYRLP